MIRLCDLGPGDENAPPEELDDGPAVVCRACWCGPGERPRALPHWHHCDLCGERCDDESSGGGVHQDSRAKREEDAKALEEAYADAEAFHSRLEREWLEAHPDFDPDEQQDTEQEARERKP